MSEGDRKVLHITDVKAIQPKINSAPKEKAKHSAAVDKVLVGKAAITNGVVAMANSSHSEVETPKSPTIHLSSPYRRLFRFSSMPDL